jgi:transcriptional regulator
VARLQRREKLLTEKEIGVLKLKSEGLTQVEIAKKLKISQPAVSNFYNNAIKKMREAEEVIRLKEELEIDI